MGLQYEDMRKYIWLHGWRPTKMREGGQIVLGWSNEEYNRKCQDIEEAYSVTQYHVQVAEDWSTKEI